MVSIIRIILNSELYSIKIIQKAPCSSEHQLSLLQGATINLSYHEGYTNQSYSNYFSSRLRYTMNGRVK